MSGANVMQAVQTVCPCAHVTWGDRKRDDIPPLPRAVYYDDYPSHLAADDDNLTVNHRWTVELLERHRSPEIEAALFSALRSAFGTVGIEEAWIETEKCHQVIYTFSEIEGA